MKEFERPMLHSGYMEIAVTGLLNYRIYTIVPNVSWGLGLRHECDLLCLSKSGHLTEVEIKISKSDLKRDFKKEHGHKNKYIQRLVYAVPVELKDIALELIPDSAGLIIVDWDKRGWWFAAWERHSKPDKMALKPDQVILNRFYRLGCMRIWSLKRHYYALQKQYQQLRHSVPVTKSELMNLLQTSYDLGRSTTRPFSDIDAYLAPYIFEDKKPVHENGK